MILPFAESAFIASMSGGGGSSATVTYPNKSEFSEVSGYPCPYLITETYNEGTDSEYKRYIGVKFTENNSTYFVYYLINVIYVYNAGFDPLTDNPLDSTNYNQIWFSNWYI